MTVYYSYIHIFKCYLPKKVKGNGPEWVEQCSSSGMMSATYIDGQLMATSGVINIDKLKSTLESWFWNQSWYTWSTVTGDGKLLGSQMRGPSERYERGVSLRAQPSEGRGNVIDVNQLQEHFFLRRKPWAYDSTKRTKTVQQGWWIHTLPVWRHQTYYLG